MSDIITPALVHERDLTAYNPDMELALMFALIEFEKRRHEQYRGAKYEFFSKILWPIALIQAGPENYIGIDRMKYFFDLEFNVTNYLSPQSTIISKIQQIREPQVLTNLLSQWIEEISVPLKQELLINGIINPEILHGLVPLIKMAREKPYNFVKWDALLSIDDLFEIAGEYNQVLKNIEKVISNWHSLQSKIQQKQDYWYVLSSKAANASEQEQIERKIEIFNKKILNIIWDCRSEIDYLYHWAIPGQNLNLVIPYNEIWISMYIAKIILPNNTPKFLVLPPSILSEKLKTSQRIPVDTFHSSFHSILKEKFESTLETQTQLRQKIEPKCNAENLFLKEDANKLVTRGFDKIQEKKLIDTNYIDDLRLKWNNILQEIK